MNGRRAPVAAVTSLTANSHGEIRGHPGRRRICVAVDFLGLGDRPGMSMKTVRLMVGAQRMGPGFCCRAPGDSEGGFRPPSGTCFHWQFLVLLRLRRTPLGSSASASWRCRNQCRPIIKVQYRISDNGPWWWTWRDSNPRPAPIYVCLQGFRPYDRFHCWPTKAIGVLALWGSGCPRFWGTSGTG